MVISLVGGLPSLPPFSRIWHAYERQLERRPILTQSATSAVLWGVGDLLAQRLADTSSQARQGQQAQRGCKVDSRRTFWTSVFGAFFIGPVGHAWYSHLDRLAMIFGSEGSTRFLLAKLAADATLWSAAYMAAFFLWGELIINKGSVEKWKQQMQREFVPTYIAEIVAWPPIMAAIFTKLPVQHHLLAVNMFTVCDVVFLAMIQSGALSMQTTPCSSSASCANSAHPAGHSKSERGKGSKKHHHHHHHGHHLRQKEGDHHGEAGGQHHLPALASMHSSNGAAVARAVGSKGGDQEGDSLAAAAAQLRQVLEAWVHPEHLPTAAAGGAAAK